LFEKYAQTNQDPIIIYNGDDYAFADGKKLLNIYDLENLFVEEHHLLV
jgi:hypothetical protein